MPPGWPPSVNRVGAHAREPHDHQGGGGSGPAHGQPSLPRRRPRRPRRRQRAPRQGRRPLSPSLEPPEHDNWEVTLDVAGSYARGYGKALIDFRNEYRKAIREIVGRPSRDLSDGPDALKELLRITPTISDTTKRPKVKAAIGKPDDAGRWTVDVRVSLPPGDKTWRFSPVLRFGTESGAPIPVVWEDLTSLDKCSVDGDVVTADARAREVRFTGRTKAESHPVGASAPRRS